jgi:hypothetical protein
MRAKPHSLIALLWLLAIAGCGAPTFDEQVLSFATPTSALQSRDPELPKLIRDVEQQRGLPLQLARTEAISSESNAAVALAEIFSPALHLHLMPRLLPLIAHGAPADKRDEFLLQQKELIEQTAQAVDRPRCVFDIESPKGFFASMSYLDDAALASRLLLLRARQSATNKDRLPAFADVLRSLRVCHALTRERRVEARALAASLRHEALGVANNCFDVGLWRRHEAEQLYALLRQQLSNWPDDGRMLVGERATVIHAYEAIRAGMLDRILTLEEYYRFNHQIEELAKATTQEVDADEARYLRALERLLDAATTPSLKRANEIDAAMDEIAAAPPLFAATLFTKDLRAAMQTAAHDRATVMAWTLALAAAAELTPPPINTSPVTGVALEVEQNAERLEIYDGQEVLVGLPLLLK